MENTSEKASYCIGLEAGTNIRRQFADVDMKTLSEGFTDGLKGSAPKLKPEEIQNILHAIRAQMEHQQKEMIGKIAQENKVKGEQFFADNKKKPGIVSVASGLQYQVLAQGTGDKPTLFDVVEVHYKGSFINGTVFDSSYDRGQPAVFPVNRIIPGWTEALQLMPVGSKWKLFIPSYLAYGEVGYGNQIPPNAALIFELELLRSKSKSFFSTRMPHFREAFLFPNFSIFEWVHLPGDFFQSTHDFLREYQ